MKTFDRAKAMILDPAREWQAVAVEPATVQDLYFGYNAPLAAIGPVATFIGTMLFGLGLPGVGLVRASTAAGVVQMLAGYVLGLVAVFLLALLIDGLAPRFGGERNRIQALKVASYASTPGWVAGILALLPALGVLAVIASLYGLYLLYLGVQTVMRAPQERAIGYCASVVAVAFVMSVVTGAVVGRIGLGLP